MQANLNISLAEYKPITTYKPKVGDFVVWHGFFTHFYGIINGCDESKIRVITAGLPALLFTMEQDEMDKNLRVINISELRRSRGAYAIQQGGIWFV